jgi:hypothetical protein
MVLTKQELIDALKHEVHILTHLCGKIQPEMLDYRPTPKQRSTMELLRYLTVMGPVLVPTVQTGTFLVEKWNEAETAAKAMDFDAIMKSLASQAAFYEASIGAMSDDDLRGEIELWGQKGRRGPRLVTLILNGHAAYRMQLFCYLKACGREELNTMNLWAGMDGPA